MFRYILLLAAFAATADTTVTLDGDLNVNGTTATANTQIDYNQTGETVELCINLSLNNTGGGGGGGGAGTPIVWKESLRDPLYATITNDGKTFNSGLGGQYTYMLSDEFYNTSRTDMVYIEIELTTSVVGNNDWLGLGWDDNIQTNYAFLRQEGTAYITGGSPVSTGLPAFEESYVVRLAIKGQQMWIGYKLGASQAWGNNAAVEVGDPAGDNNPLYTTLPADKDIQIGVWAYHANDITINSVTSDLQGSAEGITPAGES